MERDHGPFDIIGDVHGCCTELESLLRLLGYQFNAQAMADSVWGPGLWNHPEGRRAIFLGDLADRGPRILDTFRLAANMAASGNALCVPGNHDEKLRRKLRGHDVKIANGLQNSLAEVERDPGLRTHLTAFIESLIDHYVLDGGALVVAHAGMKEELQGRKSSAVRAFALYGDPTGEVDVSGLPVRRDWAANYHGRAMVVYGHTPVTRLDWVNNTVNIDTGCVFGGSLSALRYPEREFVSVKALSTYARHPIFFAGAGNVLD